MHRGVSRAAPGLVSVKMGREGEPRVNRGGNEHPSHLSSSELSAAQAPAPVRASNTAQCALLSSSLWAAV